MKILVKIDKAECFRHGFDAPKKEEIELELDPIMFEDPERAYIADNMVEGRFQGPYDEYTDPEIIKPWIAKLFKICPPNLDGFIDAVHRGMTFNKKATLFQKPDPPIQDLEDEIPY